LCRIFFSAVAVERRRWPRALRLRGDIHPRLAFRAALPISETRTMYVVLVRGVQHETAKGAKPCSQRWSVLPKQWTTLCAEGAKSHVTHHRSLSV
jgi:hypothetical protein